MPKFLGIEFAPVTVPIERRLQTLMVLTHVLNFLLWPLILSALLLFLLITPLFWLSAGYIAWMFYDMAIRKTPSRGGRRSEWLRRSKLFCYLRDYFPVSLVKTAELDPEKNYIFGYHPHGIMSYGVFVNFASEATGFSAKFPGIVPHPMTLKTNFYWPILRGYILWAGICDVSRDSLNWILTRQGKGNAAIIVVGGAAEALEAHPGNYNLTLKNRKGFVKMAIKTGASLVPVFSFGENDLFEQMDNPSGSWLRSFQERFKRLTGVSPPLFHGRGIFNYTFGLLPFRKPIHTVVGKPIDVALDKEPSTELVNKVHQQYMDELSQLFDEHKEKYGIHKERRLNFIDV